jgi:hypothetical protein
MRPTPWNDDTDNHEMFYDLAALTHDPRDVAKLRRAQQMIRDLLEAWGATDKQRLKPN